MQNNLNVQTVLQVEFRNVYGRDLPYPANDLARQFARLLNVKTFSAGQIRDIKDIGFTFEAVHSAVSL
jgi:hypothetical protein